MVDTSGGRRTRWVEPPGEVSIPRLESGLPNDSVAQCHLCSVVDRLQVVTETGINVGSVLIAQIRSVIGDLLDIS